MNEKKPITHIVAGLLIAAVLIVYSCSLYFTDTEQTGIFAIIPFIIILAGLIIFINMYGNAKNNQVTFGNLFAYGFKTTAFLTLVVILFTVIFFLIFPEIKEKIFENTREKMVEQGKMTPSEIDKAMDMWSNMFWVFTIGGILLIYAIVGAIGSLIGAAITKKKPVNPMDQLDMR